MDKSLKQTQWFVEPLDHFTNGIIALELPEENFSKVELDGQILHLWRCPSYPFITTFQNSKRTNFPLSFKVWRRKGERGKLEEWKFHLKKRNIKPAVKEAA